MILGLSVPAFTQLHVVISLVGIGMASEPGLDALGVGAIQLAVGPGRQLFGIRLRVCTV